MKTTLKIFLFLVVAFGFSATAMAQNVTSNAATGTVSVVTPLTISKDYNLSFGSIVSGATSGTVIVDYSNGSTVTGGVSKAGGTVSTAQFTVTGENGKNVIVEYTSPLTLTKSGGGTLSVALSCDAGASGSAVQLATSSPYNKIVKFGGTLTVPENTVAGTYENTSDLKITVHYQ